MTTPMVHSNLTNETELLARIAEGDQQAYTLVYNHYNHCVHWFMHSITNAPKHDLQDIIQEVFIAIWEKRSILTGILNFQNYIFSMARYALLNSERQKKLRRKTFQHYTDYRDTTYDGSMDSELFPQTLHASTLKAINYLTTSCRDVFVLYIFYGLSRKQIAAKMKITTQGVGSQLKKAIEEVKKYLKKYAFFIFSILIILRKLY